AIQPIFAGGRIVNANRLANLGIEAAKTQAEVSKRDIIENVESTYFLVLGLQEKVATVDSTLSLLDSLTKTVNVALNAGLVTKSDALQVELKKNEMRAMQLQLSNAISLASQLLCIQIGIDYPEDGLTLSDDLQAYSSIGILNIPPLSPVGFRPETDLLDMQVEAEQLRKKISIGAALPQVMLGGAYYWGNPVKTQFDHNGLLFATAIVPLTQWWETSHKIREHNVAIRQYELQRDDLTKKMWLENQQVYNSMLEAAALLRSDSSALEMAKENYRIASLNYKAGINTLNDVLQAQALMLQAQNTLTDRRITFLTAQRRHADMCRLGNFDYIYRSKKGH
ncbi:MAG: TolC family protein, partial [Paludibacteraceae bacterium]|nr:TolC family protein [Paludibacteraceae bacterium]